MLVTLFADASYYSETKSGAWACYAISAVDRLTYAGRFTKPIINSSHAELAAIANALHVILPHRLSAGAKRILIQTDCQAAIDWIQNGQSRQHPAIVDHILETMEKYGVSHEVRHIKAHVGTGDPRAYCHDWCDREARRIAKVVHKERGRADRGHPLRTKKLKKTGTGLKMLGNVAQKGVLGGE